MPNRSARTRSLRRPATVTFLLLSASILVLTACTRATEEQSTPIERVSTSEADPAATSSTPREPTAQPSAPQPVPLLPPSSVVSADPPPPLDSDVQSPPAQQSASLNPNMQVPTPSTPRAPPAAPLDSRGFPLGTTCDAFSCTSPDGMTFVNPDAFPEMSGKASELICGQTFCPPPGLQMVPDPLPSTPLQSTGSAE